MSNRVWEIRYRLPAIGKWHRTKLMPQGAVNSLIEFYRRHGMEYKTYRMVNGDLKIMNLGVKA